MTVAAVYNMKGGLGKTTTAVNLSHLAAAAGRRVLLWDLDPQAASSFAFRIRPRVAGFGRKTLESGRALAAAIKETDYNNLDLLPADFTYRKLDRLLDDFDKPERVLTSLLDTFGRDYDLVFLDCPAGFSLLIEAVFRAADAVLVPTIPTVLSLRMVARLIKWANRSDSPSELLPFFSMVDRRKTLHRRACDWSADYPEVFLIGQIPYASVVEQMAVRRMPLGAFAGRDPVTTAFAGIWAELQTRLYERREASHRMRGKWGALLQAIESFVVRLESMDGQEPTAFSRPLAFATSDDRKIRDVRDVAGSQRSFVEGEARVGSALEGTSPQHDECHFVHSFDTDRQDVSRCGYILELRERPGCWLIVAAPSRDEEGSPGRRAEAQIDSSWAMEILSGAMSPLEALERRLGSPGSALLDPVRVAVDGQTLRRTLSRVMRQAPLQNPSLNRRRA